MEDLTMPLTEHLEELRWRLVRSLIAIAVAFTGCYTFAEYLFTFLTRPLMEFHGGVVQLIGTGVPEAFFTKLKVSLIASLFAASPVLFYQIWQFIVPGLYESERSFVRPFVFFATIFFLLGASFCYIVIFPVGFTFFVEQYATIGVAPTIRISEYLSFTSRLLLAFGVVFELPVATFFLARIGLVTHHGMFHYLRYAVLGSFVVSAILTPPDAVSQVLMAAPLILLYTLSIGVAYFFGTKKPPPADEDAAVSPSD